jgi:hypothetical protein
VTLTLEDRRIMFPESWEDFERRIDALPLGMGDNAYCMTVEGIQREYPELFDSGYFDE